MMGAHASGVGEDLGALVRRSGALVAFIITKEGNLIAQAGGQGLLDPIALAALIAGMFSATREVARLLGERHFSILLQQGERRHLHISLVSPTAMMVVVFEGDERIGQVRYQARKLGSLIGQRLVQQMGRQGAGPESPYFKEVALDLIDRIFEAGDRGAES